MEEDRLIWENKFNAILLSISDICSVCDLTYDEIEVHLDFINSLIKKLQDRCTALEVEKVCCLPDPNCEVKPLVKFEWEESFLSDVGDDTDNIADVDLINPSELLNETSCRYCYQDWPDSESLQNHILQVHKQKNFVCTVCKKRFLKEITLTFHMMVHDNTLRIPPSFYDNNSKELKKKRTTDAFICNLCDRSFAAQSALSMHLKFTDKSGCPGWPSSRKRKRPVLMERNFPCPTCGKMFFNRSSVTYHMMVHTEVKKHACNICSKKFRQKQHVKRHVEEVHMQLHLQGDKVLKCPFCSIHFSTNSYRARHVKKCKNNPGVIKMARGAPMTCLVCRKRFTNKTSFKLHYIRCHQSHTFFCEICKKSFAYKAELERHVLIQHSDVKQFACHFCGKCFATSNFLSCHMLYHNKRYMCEECGKTFFFATRLEQHKLKCKPMNDVDTCS